MGQMSDFDGFGVTMVEAAPRGFAVTVGFERSRAVLRVRGEVDLFRSPDLAALLHAVIDQGHRSLVIDLAGLSFIDASGLRIIADGASRLRQSGGELVIGSPPAMFRRLIDITGMSELFKLEATAEVATRLAAEESVDLPTTPPMSDPLALVRPISAVTAVPANHDVVDAALRLVVALASATVGGADGVSVSLRRHGHLSTVAASDQTISDMDANQYATGEGPCVDASVEGRWFHAAALDTETRWPAFTPRACALGINAILSSPLLTAERPLGALNIYSRSVAAFAPKDQELAAVFATEASAILTYAGVDVTEDQLSERLGQALRTRQIIAQGLGVIMEREGIGEDGAYTLLREFSQNSNQPLRERAKDVVASARRAGVEHASRPEGDHHG